MHSRYYILMDDFIFFKLFNFNNLLLTFKKQNIHIGSTYIYQFSCKYKRNINFAINGLIHNFLTLVSSMIISLPPVKNSQKNLKLK